MCFSASASFGASVVLGTIGVVTLTKVKEPKQIAFAVIPLMFAVQQVAEGMLWIGLSGPAHASWRHFPVYIFLVFAQLIWPVWIPFSLSILEEDQIKKRVLQVLLGMGLIVSLYLMYCMFVYPVSAEIRSGHIQYTLSFPLALVSISSIIYFIPTVISLFASSVRHTLLLGIAILISFAVSKIFFDDFLISVWCFFAAILSLIILKITSTFSKENKLQVA